MAETERVLKATAARARRIASGVYSEVRKPRTKKGIAARKEAAVMRLRRAGLMEPSQLANRAEKGGYRMKRNLTSPNPNRVPGAAAMTLMAGSKRKTAAILRKARKQGAAKR